MPWAAAWRKPCDEGTFEGKLPEGLLPDAVEAVVRTAEFMDALRGQGE